MRFDLDKVGTAIAYKLLAATVVPRPIAWVVTKDQQGQVNAAPYSFFNVMGSAPPTIALGLLADPERGFKDTARNILDTGEFVINLVPERLVAAMNLTAVDAPRGVDELALAGLETLPSTHIAPPISSTSCLDIASPNPVPPYLRVVEASACSIAASPSRLSATVSASTPNDSR